MIIIWVTMLLKVCSYIIIIIIIRNTKRFGGSNNEWIWTVFFFFFELHFFIKLINWFLIILQLQETLKDIFFRGGITVKGFEQCSFFFLLSITFFFIKLVIDFLWFVKKKTQLKDTRQASKTRQIDMSNIKSAQRSSFWSLYFIFLLLQCF
jgi:hypothetical protein